MASIPQVPGIRSLRLVWWASAALAACLTALAFSATARAAFPGTNSRIFFSANREAIAPSPGDHEIYSINPDGTGLLKLTDNGTDDRDPVVSPDGRKVAFAANRDGNWEIYVMNAADGSDQTRVTSNGLVDLYPAWYPDGLYLAESRGSGTASEIHRIKVAGGEDVALTDDSAGAGAPDAWPTVTPDGSKVLWVRDIGSSGSLDTEIFSMNALDGSGKANLTNNGSSDYNRPSVSPDGTRFAWSSQRSGYPEVLTANVSNGGSVNVFTDSAGLPGSFFAFSPAYSPDGELLALGSFYGGLGQGIWKVAWDGAALNRVTTPPDEVSGPEGVAIDWAPATTESLSVSTAGTGAGTVSATSTAGTVDPFTSQSFVTGTSVTLSPSPAPGSVFTGWSGGGCVGFGDCTVTMSEPKSFTAFFDVPARVSITGKPRSTTKSKIATFRFVPVAGGADSYSCKLDGRAAAPCASPVTYRRLKKGRHVFRVHSTLGAINGQSTVFRWRVR